MLVSSVLSGSGTGERSVDRLPPLGHPTEAGRQQPEVSNPTPNQIHSCQRLLVKRQVTFFH